MRAIQRRGRALAGRCGNHAMKTELNLLKPEAQIPGPELGMRPPHNMRLWFFIAIFIVSCLLLGWLLFPFLSILALGAVVTGIFRPVHLFLISKWKFNETLAALTTCLLVFIILFLPITFLVGVLSKEAWNLYLTAKTAVLGEQIQGLLKGSFLLEKINAFLGPINMKVTWEDLYRAISELGKTVGLFLFKQTNSIATNILSFIVNFVFMQLVIFFLLKDAERLINFITHLSPLPREQDQQLITKFKEMSGAILLGNGLGGLIQGVLGGLAFALLGFDSPFLWGVIMGILAFLPIVGIGAVFLPAAVYLFLTGRMAAGIIFVIFYVMLSGLVEYIFKPKVVGDRVKMHTLLVFLAIVGGLKLFGILGIVYGPLVVTGFLTLTEIYHASYQEQVEPEEK